MSDLLECPFPYFGGKRRAKHLVWPRFGDVPNYIEPFFGSGAILLGRPEPGKIETVNDLDAFVANFWRAIQRDPDAVAKWADQPVNEADLHARHRWLMERLPAHREKMFTDPDYFDAQIAGWWCWGLSCWIGGGWCGGIKRGTPRPNLNPQGVHRKRSRTERGSSARPALGNTGTGVHALGQRLPSIGNGGKGIHGVSKIPCQDWFRALQERLRYVRVVCGDWTRVLGDSVLGKGKNVGGLRPCAIFFDPPYTHDLRDRDLYAEEDPALSAEVRKWAIEHGDDPDLRIALCGYEGEHEMPESWTKIAWKAHRGYAGDDNDNVTKERIWFSPHCLVPDAEPVQSRLFDWEDDQTEGDG